MKIKNWLFSLFVIPASLVCQNLAAASSSISNASAGAPKSVQKSPVTHGNTNVQGFFRFEGMKYQTSLRENEKLDQSMLLSTNLNVAYSSADFYNVMDLTAGKYMDLGGSQLSVSQLFASARFNEGKLSVAGGRKLEYWSLIDQDWQLGLWQPQSTLDALRPEDQGLTGIFYKQKNDSYDLLLFASPFFIPTMGPSIQEKNGSLVSDSRWYQSPSSSFPLNGQETRLVYSLNTPDYKELINNPGGGGRLTVGGDSPGWWASVNGGYKPINALLLKYKTALNLPEMDPQTGEVTVSPAVGYHRLWGADVGYRFLTGMIAFSYLEDSPEQKFPRNTTVERNGTVVDEIWVQQVPKPLRAFSVHYDGIHDLPFFFEPVGIKLSYLRVNGAGITDYDAQGVDQGAIFDSRLNFTNAASVKFDFQTRIFSKKSVSSLKYMREFDQRGTLVNGELTIFLQKKLAMIAGLDILGVDDASLANEDTRFLNQFRANDRGYLGVSYVY